MDWFSWLSKTSLDPSVVREYAIDFADNELEEDDIAHFNHEFLQSMGISIAKHRLEILKLARKRKGIGMQSISRLLFAIKRTNKILGKCFRKLVSREDSALVVVPKRSYSTRWKGMLLRRNKRSIRGRQQRLMITNRPNYTPDYSFNNISISSPILQAIDNKKISEDAYDDAQSSDYNETELESNGEEYLSNSFKDIKWDAMFKDMNPT